MTTNDLLLGLIAVGFDKSHLTEDGGARVHCSQCEAYVINGLPTHEHGCPNIAPDYDEDYVSDYDLDDEDISN